jgi:hypothetical protein
LGVAGFVAIAALGLALDLRSRRTARGPTFAQAVSWLDARIIGRLALFVLWGFAGWHFFVR